MGPKTLREFIALKAKEEPNKAEVLNSTLDSWDRYLGDISNGCFLSWEKCEDLLSQPILSDSPEADDSGPDDSQND